MTERQAAGTDSATGSDSRLDECMRQCLTKAAADYDLVDFDSDDDGVIDAVGFLHSGSVCHCSRACQQVNIFFFFFLYTAPNVIPFYFVQGTELSLGEQIATALDIKTVSGRTNGGFIPHSRQMVYQCLNITSARDCGAIVAARLDEWELLRTKLGTFSGCQICESAGCMHAHIIH